MNNIKTLILLFILSILMFLGLDCKKPVEPQENLPEQKLQDVEASWSPDGQWIVYRHEDYSHIDATYPNGLYIIDTNGNSRRMLIPGEASHPDWSPDGKWIAYCDGAIYIVKSTGDSVSQITPFTSFFPSWSPDGKNIVFDTPYHDPKGANVIWIINADGTNLKDISQHQTGEWRSPEWSAIDNKLLHVRYIEDVLGEEIFLMDTNGLHSLRLTNNIDKDRYPTRSRDGNTIAWSKIVKGGEYEVWFMKKDGSSQRKFKDGFYPTWSTNSQKIIFSNFNSNKTKIVLWAINISGSGLKQITQ